MTESGPGPEKDVADGTPASQPGPAHPYPAGRTQDQGRAHRRRGRPGAATASLLARYQSTMRAELERLLTELEATVAGLGGVVILAIDKPNDRSARWDLAMKLARELGTEVDPTPPPDPGADKPVVARPRRRRVDYG